MMKLELTLLILSFLLLVYYKIHLYDIKEGFDRHIREGKVTFYSKQAAQDLFKTDPDSYFENLTELDKKAMNVKDTDDAIQKMVNACMEFSTSDKIRLLKFTAEGDRFLRQLKLPYVDTKKIANMDWNLVLTRDTANEEGMPHTKGDVIYLSTIVLDMPTKELIKTLIHEKVHVYERANPKLMKEWMKYKGYKLNRRQSEIKEARSNPDVDGWTYISPEGKETVVLYRHSNPKTIEEANYPRYDDPSSEHPYEDLAYYVDSLYK